MIYHDEVLQQFYRSRPICSSNEPVNRFLLGVSGLDLQGKCTHIVLILQVQPSSHPAFKVLVTQLTIPSQSTGTVDISLDSAVSPGVLQGCVSIAFEGLQPALPTVNATLRARVQELAVKFSSSSVDFGKVALQTERTRSVTVCNLTGVSIALKGQVQHDAQLGVFTVGPAAVTLPPYDEVSCTDTWFACLHRVAAPPA